MRDSYMGHDLYNIQNVVPDAIDRYLRYHGWKRKHDFPNKNQMAYENKNAFPTQLVIPAERTFSDYHILLKKAIQILAENEKRDAFFVIKDMMQEYMAEEYMLALRSNTKSIALCDLSDTISSGWTSEDTYEITLPFLDRHNDHIQVYLIFLDGSVILSDGGFVWDEALSYHKNCKAALLQNICRQFGVKMRSVGNCTEVTSGRIRPLQYSDKFWMFVQAILLLANVA